MKKDEGENYQFLSACICVDRRFESVFLEMPQFTKSSQTIRSTRWPLRTRWISTICGSRLAFFRDGWKPRLSLATGSDASDEWEKITLEIS